MRTSFIIGPFPKVGLLLCGSLNESLRFENLSLFCYNLASHARTSGYKYVRQVSLTAEKICCYEVVMQYIAAAGTAALTFVNRSYF